MKLRRDCCRPWPLSFTAAGASMADSGGNTRAGSQAGGNCNRRWRRRSVRRGMVWALACGVRSSPMAEPSARSRFRQQVHGQWPGSRIEIFGAKANTANDYSLSKKACRPPPAHSATGLFIVDRQPPVQQGAAPAATLRPSTRQRARSEIAYQGSASTFWHALRSDRRPAGRRGQRLWRRSPRTSAAASRSASGQRRPVLHRPFVAWHLRHNLKLDYLSGVGGIAATRSSPTT